MRRLAFLLASLLVIAGVSSLRGESETPESSHLAYLQRHGQRPVEYVLGKFKDHQVVALGEIHEIQQNLDLLTEIIRDERFLKEVGVLVWEFGSARDQQLLDRVLSSRSFQEAPLVGAFREHTHPWGWAFQAYLDVYRAAWTVNRSGHAHLRVILADVPIRWSNIRSLRDYESVADERDAYMAQVIEREIIQKGRKALFYAGKNHVLRNLRLASGGCRKTAVHLLATKHPSAVFSIATHQANSYDPVTKHTRRVCDGLFDGVFRSNDDRPVGFDLKGSPFGRASERCIDTLKAPSGLRLEELYDGYIFMCPLERYRHTAIIAGFYDDAYFKTVVARSKIAFGYDLTERLQVRSPREFTQLLEGGGVGNKNLQPIHASAREHRH